jgi:glutamine synthetase
MPAPDEEALAMTQAPDATELVQILTTDLVAITRGRSVARDDEAAWRGSGVGWVPANLALTPFGDIAEPNPFGSSGDLRLRPDPATEVRLDGPAGRPPLHFVLADITELDGSPWSLCSRSFLRSAIAELEREGLRLISAFEQEFTLGGASAPAPAFSLAAHRRAEPLLTQIFAALRQAGAQPETILPEYGVDQFEVTCRPTEALAAADRAVVIRAVMREVAEAAGRELSFSPKPAPEGVGNGVHIHFSLVDVSGRPATYDPARPGRVSEPAASFVAGVLRHMPALCAILAPSPVSYLRLVPHHWSAAYACLGERNREAAIRICPLPASAADPARSFNLELRATDSTANPYLALGVLLRAGIAGLRARLPLPGLLNADPDGLSAEERARLGVKRLPETLSAALIALDADEEVKGWFTPAFLETFRGVKTKEIATAQGLVGEELCARYRAVY